MAIWKTPISIEKITDVRIETMVSLLGIEFLEVGDDYLTGRMPVDKRTIQPYGIMHGGASCVLAETLGSIAGNHCIDMSTQVCVGLDIHTNHIRQVREGFVYGKAAPIHLGRTTQVWEIRIDNEQKKLISITRLTLAVIAKSS